MKKTAMSMIRLQNSQQAPLAPGLVRNSIYHEFVTRAATTIKEVMSFYDKGKIESSVQDLVLLTQIIRFRN